MLKVSVVLPTYNRLNQLKRVIAGLEMQSYPLDDFEVIVVSDGSPDGTNDYLKSINTPLNLRPVMQPNQGVAVARNNGIAQSEGEIVLFIDDDVVPTSQLMEQHLAWHSAENTVVMGPMLTPPDFDMAPWVDWEQRMLMKQYDDMNSGAWEPTARQFYTGNTSLRRQHLLDAGGFDPTFRRAEDVELAYRLGDMGLKFLFNSQAIGYHYAQRSFQSWMAIPYAYGRNDVIFTHQKGQTWLLKTIWMEYHKRNPLIRGLTRVCLDRPLLNKAVTTGLGQVAQVGHKLSIDPLPRMAYSGIFNLRHYQGVSDELGGRKKFFAGVASEAVD